MAVVVNQNSTNSIQLANYYCESRQIPPQNVLRINWSGNVYTWAETDYNSVLLNPLLAMFAARQLTNQIDYVVLSMDIPYQISSSRSFADNGTTSTLFYGFKPDLNPPCSLAPGSANLYAGSESSFRAVPPLSAASNSFLVSMITSSNLAAARQIVAQGVASDGTFPTQTVYLSKNPYDAARNVRFVLYDNAIFNARVRGYPAMQRNVAFTPNGLGSTFGFQGGTQDYTLSGVSVSPGGIADNLTSYGGLISGAPDQMNMLAFLAAGAVGTFGTVDEPCNYLEKFPNPMDYFYQARGFSLAEAYYQSVTNPYQGLMVAEPLAAPFARPSTGAWTGLPANAVLRGVTNLSLQITAADPSRPVSQVDLFLDGTFLRTLTNIAPLAGNVLTVHVNGKAVTYTVPVNSSLNRIATGLANALNLPGVTNTTRVVAWASGDRVELHSTDLTTPGASVPVAASTAIGSAPSLTTFLQASGTNFLDSVANGLRGFEVTNTPLMGDYLKLVVTKLSGLSVTNAVTNNTRGTTVSLLVSNLVSVINADPRLQTPDGVVAEDWFNGDFYLTPTFSQFNIRALSPGWAAAQVHTVLSCSTNLFVAPGDSQPLEDYVSDLQPRAHLYITSGVTNLPLTFAFDTTTQSDGFHELTVVIYEGSNVRTQKRLAQSVTIQNTPLSATLTAAFGSTNVAVEATVPLSITANTNAIASIELFSTGGSLGVVSNQPTATFSVPGASLEVGLHPFYAILTAPNGTRFRTATQWIRFVGPEPPFRISLTTTHPPRLAWPATAGRNYDILAAPNLGAVFQLSASLVPTNANGGWTETNPPSTTRFYRIRTLD